MTKDKFLKLLETKLKILNDKEKRKNINKYKKLIDKKIKEGKIETEVIESLGDIDDIVNSILESYKKDDNNLIEIAKDTKKIIDKYEKKVNKTIKDINDGFQNIENNLKKSDGSLNYKLVFKFLFNILLSILLILLFKMPFGFMSDLGEVFFYTFMAPANHIFTYIWDFILGFIYLIASVLIIVAILKQYSNKAFAKNNKLQNNSCILTLTKIIGTVMLLIPAWGINFSLIIFIFLLIYLLFEGISVVGLLILMIGLSLLFGLLADVIDSFLYTHKKIYTLPFVISAFLIMIGSILFTLNMKNFTYKNEVSNNIESKELIYEEFVKERLEIEDSTLIIDEKLKDNQVIIKVKYYNVLKPIILKDRNEIKVDFLNEQANVLKMIIDDLKQNKIYNYKKIFSVNIEVYSNTNTSKLISLN